jgi:glycosyltransferase involved in cell wall biosynthesis
LPVLAPEFGALGAGGAELQLTLLAKALARRSLDVSMIVADHGQPDGAEWFGVKTYKASRPDAGIPGIRAFYPRLTKLWAAMWRADADVYYTMCAGRMLLEMVAFAHLFKRKAVFGAASDSDCDPSQLLIGRRGDQRLYAAGLRLADAVLAQTPAQQCALLDNFDRESSVVEALAEFNGKVKPFAERDIDVLWVGNMRPLKRPDLLIELAKRLPQLSFHMIGGPMPNHADFFETISRQAAQVPNLTFHGHVPYHDVTSFFERARLYASTSNTEGFPNTFLQAWSCGTPVLSFLDPDDLIRAQRLGHAVTSLDEMQASLVALRSDTSTWQATSSRCLQYMSKHYDEDARLEPYLQTFTRLAGDRLLRSRA